MVITPLLAVDLAAVKVDLLSTRTVTVFLATLTVSAALANQSTTASHALLGLLFKQTTLVVAVTATTSIQTEFAELASSAVSLVLVQDGINVLLVEVTLTDLWMDHALAEAVTTSTR